MYFSMNVRVRYNSFSAHLRRQFGCRVYKVSVDAGFTCPTRDGTKARGGCLYCGEEGSRASYCDPDLPIGEQVRRGIEFLRRRYKAEKFIAYFQPYTNTYAPVEVLRRAYDEALSVDTIVGLSIGTRPDCISPQVLDLLEDYQGKTYLWVEYGLQSAREKTLELINRHHTVSEFVSAVEQTRDRGIRVCAHVILGLPKETRSDMLASADLLNSLGVNGVKIHSLYVNRNAPLARMYQAGELRLLSLEEYVALVCDYLERLAPDILIHRLTGEAPPTLLVAPQWCTDKSGVIRCIQQELERRDSVQGSRYPSSSC
jgi:radical SAM protein (TIGR01212 family)